MNWIVLSLNVWGQLIRVIFSHERIKLILTILTKIRVYYIFMILKLKVLIDKSLLLHHWVLTVFYMIGIDIIVKLIKVFEFRTPILAKNKDVLG